MRQLFQADINKAANSITNNLAAPYLRMGSARTKTVLEFFANDGVDDIRRPAGSRLDDSTRNFIAKTLAFGSILSLGFEFYVGVVVQRDDLNCE